MRRALRSLALVLVAVAAIAPPLASEGTAPRATRPNFCARSTLSLDSIRFPGTVPPPVEMMGCTADQNCYCAPPVSCSGNTTCIVGSNYVDCDGNRTYCCTGPLCQPPEGCYSPATFCDCRELGFGFGVCFDANC